MTESWIKKKTADKKFYGYTGPVKPEKKRSSKWIAKKSDKEEKKEKKKTNWITKKKTNKFYGYTGPVKPSK